MPYRSLVQRVEALEDKVWKLELESYVPHGNRKVTIREMVNLILGHLNLKMVREYKDEITLVKESKT